MTRSATDSNETTPEKAAPQPKLVHNMLGDLFDWYFASRAAENELEEAAAVGALIRILHGQPLKTLDTELHLYIDKVYMRTATASARFRGYIGKGNSVGEAAILVVSKTVDNGEVPSN